LFSSGDSIDLKLTSIRCLVTVKHLTIDSPCIAVLTIALPSHDKTTTCQCGYGNIRLSVSSVCIDLCVSSKRYTTDKESFRMLICAIILESGGIVVRSVLTFGAAHEADEHQRQ